jgi:phosphoglycolate phosphatase
VFDQVEGVMRIVFDLDGTLVDSVPDLSAAVNVMLSAEGVAPLDQATVTGFVGNGLPKLVERTMAHVGLDPAEHARLTQATLKAYKAEPTARTRVYPGVEEALARLRAAGHRLGLCTNKPHDPAMDVMDHFGLTQYFEVVIGGDSLPVKKPDPEPLLHSLVALGDGPALFVGDSEVDAETALRAGVDFALFTEGYRKGPVDSLPHRYVFSHFRELRGLLG